MAARLSVVIPTHRRAKILAECLRHLEHQTASRDIEVIVVSDGHDDETAALFTSSSWKVPVMFLEIPKSQQGSARNAGIAKAAGKTALFIGDDIFLAPNACEKHLAAHGASKHPIAVLGFTTWDPSVGITPIMTWLEQSGWQFGYPKISAYSHDLIPQNIQHQFTYTSHISLPLDVAKKLPFRTDVHLYGWEDIEWGMRLKSSGVRLYYEPDATALHHHSMTLEDSLKRMQTLGVSAVQIAKNVPEFDRVPRGWKRWAYRFLAVFPTLSGRHRRSFLQGLNIAEAR